MCIYIETAETWSCGLYWPIKMLSNDFIYWVQRVATFFVNRAKMFKHQDRSSITAYYYLYSSGRWGLLRPARRLCHPSRSAADAAAAPHKCQPSWFLSFSMVLLHVSLGRPRLLLPSGARVSAVLKILPGLVLKTCPIHLHLLTRMRADTGVLPTQ